MPFAPLRRAGLLALLAAVAVAGTAAAALVEVNGLVLRADGGFEPQVLPRNRFAPIDFHGQFQIAAKRGGRPPALNQAVIDFDRDGRLDIAGLPTCSPQTIAGATTGRARRLCRGAIVGSGVVDAVISLPFGSARGSAALTVFNGPRLQGHPTVILHTHTVLPVIETYAIVVPIERRSGPYRYRITVDVPPIAGGLGSLTGVKVKVGRRYRAGGREHSYVSARCSDNVLDTHGRFTFGDGTVIDGNVEKYCRMK